MKSRSRHTGSRGRLEQNDVTKSVSSGSVSVAKDSSSKSLASSRSLACENFSEGKAFIRLHCVATLLWLA